MRRGVDIYAYYHLVMAALPVFDRIMIDYSATKAAFVALSRSLAVHLAPPGARATSSHRARPGPP
jgi:NAD(P)-dependent dehydrogenase (short-subunit alcohol dehydrogenase family)